MAVPIVVLSHLRWDFVYQRPQQVLSRLAHERKVIFVEEPMRDDHRGPHWVTSTPEPNVTVYRPYTNIDAPPIYCDEQLALIQPLMTELLKREQLDDYVLWFYTPMALPLAQSLSPRAIVYDCMDELSAFKGAPPNMLAREAELLQLADVVFTGGPSLYRSKQNRHDNVHCFPSSVDQQHFGKARDPNCEPSELRKYPRPRLGFFGVIDERFDIDILDHASRERPDWQLMMVGPVVKIDPEQLPKRSNIHYFGQQSYADLPGHLAGWDVCLLPFARNESTKFISPTKTLEYMAAGKPIVSTPITDVAEPYGHIVYLGDDPESFVAACDEALNASQEEHERRFNAMRQVLARTSWDRTAQLMSDEIERVLNGRRGRSADQVNLTAASGLNRGKRDAAISASRQATARTTGSPGSVIIIGAGPTGLSATYHLGKDALLLERNNTVGGWCRSFVKGGFTFDMAGHIMFSKDAYVHEMYKMLLRDNVHWQDREAWIYSKNVYTRYPFQGCLYGLPAEVITECIVGAIEARFGTLKNRDELEDNVAKAAANNHRTDHSKTNGNGEQAGHNGEGRAIRTGQPTALRGNGSRAMPTGVRGNAPNGVKSNTSPSVCSADKLEDCCADGILESEVTLTKRNGNSDATNGSSSNAEPRNFEEFIYKVWGRGIARHFAIPYNRKLWAVPLDQMETSWLGGRVPMPDLEDMIRNALQPAAKPMGPNARFGYPLRGGFQALMNGFLPYVKDQLLLNASVRHVSPASRTVTLADGRTFSYDVLISTMPLPLLIRAIGDEAPAAVHQAVSRLRYVSVRCVNIGVGRANLTDKHWIYYPEDTVFHRIFVQGNASPYCNPPGGFGLTCEISYSPDKPLPCEGDELIQRCIRDCHRVGMFNPDDPIWVAFQVDLPHAYVVYDHDRAKNVKLIRDWLREQDILLAGRYSEWEYYNSDHAFIAGRNAAEQARQILRRRTPAVKT